MMRTILILALAMSAWAVEIPTGQVDNSRTSANTSESILTPANVASSRFVKLGSYTVTGSGYGGMIYVPCGGATKGLIVPTSTNDLYCFDASASGVGSAALWHVNMGTTWPASSTPGASPLIYITTIGCDSSPVADVAANRLYIVCMNVVATIPTYVLFKLNLATGATISSVTIAGTYGGVTFSAGRQSQRASLTLANSRVYVCFGSFADDAPWHGWAIAYDTSTMTQAAIFSGSVSGSGAGLWGSSGGLSVDGSGNLYSFTGNGTYDGLTEWGESILKWDADLTLLDWFTPTNWAALNAGDLDLSSGRAMLVPGTNLIVGGAKDFYVYSIDQTSGMGHLGGGTHQIFVTEPQATTDHTGIYGGTFINSKLYVPNTGGKIYGFTLTGSTFNTTPFTSSANYPFPGANLSSSSNGATNTIIWATVPAADALTSAQASYLKAFDSNLNEIYSSSIGGTMSKFIAPLVADGQVFIATYSGDVPVYGLTPLTTSGLSVGGLLSFGGAVSIGGQGVGGVPNTGYQFRRSITINHLKVPNTDQVDFPVLISGTYSYLATVANGGKAQSLSGDDIVYTSDPACNSLLTFERATWVATTGEVNFWVRIPSVSSLIDTVFYECYGNTSIVSFQGGVQGSTWIPASEIHHFADGSTLSGADASANNATLTNYAATAVVGLIDGAAGTRSSKYLHNDGTAPTALPSPPLTFSVWVKTTQATNAPFATFGRDTGANQCALYMNQSPAHNVSFTNGGTFTANTTSDVNDGNWHYLVGVADNVSGSNNTHIYFDGVLQGTGTVFWNISVGSPIDNLTVGRLGGGLQPMTASQDELHIFPVAHSADWISTEYNNQSSPSTFYTVGAEVPL